MDGQDENNRREWGYIIKDKILFIQPQTHMGKMLKPLQSEQANSWHLCALQQGTKN